MSVRTREVLQVPRPELALDDVRPMSSGLCSHRSCSQRHIVLDGTSPCRGHWRSAVANGIVALQGRVRTYLQQELGIEADTLEMRQFGHGQSNPTYYLKVLPSAG